MTNAALDDARDDKPLDPAVERVRRKMVRLLVVSIGVMMIGLMAVLLAIVYRTGDKPPQPVAAGGDFAIGAGGGVTEGRIALPAGAKLVSQSLDGVRLSLVVQLADSGQAIFIYDLRENRIVGRFAVTAE